MSIHYKLKERITHQNFSLFYVVRFSTKMSLQTPYKIRLFISGGASWQQNNEGWEFCTQLPVRRVMMLANITHLRMVSYIESKSGMEPSVSVTRLVYNDSDKVYILWTNEDVTHFL